MRHAFLIAVSVLMSVFGSAPAAPPLADRLPADTNVYVGWAGRNLAFDGSMFGQVVNHPTTGQIAAAIHQALGDHLADGQSSQMIDDALAMLSIAWQHPAAFCVMDIP